jgi:hypothetical protein
MLKTELKQNKETEASNSLKIEGFKADLLELENSDESLEEMDLEEIKLTSVIDNIEKSGIIARLEGEVKILKNDISELEGKRKQAADQRALLYSDQALVEKIALHNTTKLRKREECEKM